MSEDGHLVTQLFDIPQDPNIYLIGTWDGLIHKCTCSNTQHFLESYRSHLVGVNIQPDVYLDLQYLLTHLSTTLNLY